MSTEPRLQDPRPHRAGLARPPAWRRTMNHSVKYVGLDVHKDSIAVAVAEDGQRAEVREHGPIANTPTGCYQTNLNPSPARPISPSPSPPMSFAAVRAVATSTPSIWSPGSRKKTASARRARSPPSSPASTSSCSTNWDICRSPDQAASCCFTSSASFTNAPR